MFSQTEEDLYILKLWQESVFANGMDASTSKINREAGTHLKHVIHSFQRVLRRLHVSDLKCNNCLQNAEVTRCDSCIIKLSNIQPFCETPQRFDPVRHHIGSGRRLDDAASFG
ncbi:hypothetical protein SAMN02982919_00442 [Giesbergeria anulus]|uniref:Uncharacterized protein n=1 Tax=Giesbergeria anulus TaxID=180197 RepID=A0A1H9F359_9BURK|nr:hypothetical protein SAMN02982919_00442 [Giesbergeria anulus]